MIKTKITKTFYLNRENNKIIMEKTLTLILFIFIFLITPNIITAADSAFTLRQDNSEANITVQVINSDNSVATASANCYLTVKNPSSLIIKNYIQMGFIGNGFFSLNVGDAISEIGQYSTDLNCDNGASSYLKSTFYFTVNETGDNLDDNQGLMVLAQLGMIVLFLVLGFSFSREKWKVRSLFFMGALLMGVISLNSIRIIAGNSAKLSVMGNTGLILGIVLLSFMFLYILIFYTIEIFKQFREKRRMRWQIGTQY